MLMILNMPYSMLKANYDSNLFLHNRDLAQHFCCGWNNTCLAQLFGGFTKNIL